MNTALLIGLIIVGLCFVGGAVILSSAITGAVSAMKDSSPQALQQPTLKFLTEYDAADYIGVSINELDYMRSEGLLEGTFLAVTSLEQTGEEEYTDIVDGVEVVKLRPVMSNVTRFLFNCELLDERMLELIHDGNHINPNRPRRKNNDGASSKYGKKNNGNKQDAGEKAETEARAEDITESKSEPEGRSESKSDFKKEKPEGSKKSGGKKSEKKPRPEGGVTYSDKYDGGADEDPSPVYSHDDATVDFPIVKPAARVVPRPKIDVIPGDDDEGTIDIMQMKSPKKHN